MKRETLSICPFYGGKGRMAHFIADRLNYDDSDIFVTPFGGMCRVLLNKPRHEVEFYNDYSSGLTALIGILSNPDTAYQFIHRLDDETYYDEAVFDHYKAIYDNADNDLEEQEYEKLRQLLIKKEICTPFTAKHLLNYILGLETALRGDSVKEGYAKFEQVMQDNKSFKGKFQHICKNWDALYQLKEMQGFLPRPVDMGEYVSDMDLAMATYVVFQQSRSAMGKAWSEQKFKTNAQYKKQITKLYDCAERLEGVGVFQIDALDFFINYQDGIEDIEPDFSTLAGWMNDPRVMMYCDPSYIDVKDEEELLEGIDIDGVDSLSDALRERGRREPKNLGRSYSRSFGYAEQEKFVRCIQKARCRVLVSNYDSPLYNKYLNENTGWRKETFETFTSVGSKKDSKRTEAIWYNY